MVFMIQDFLVAWMPDPAPSGKGMLQCGIRWLDIRHFPHINKYQDPQCLVLIRTIK
ncbi:protein of unknown function [Cupriavidus taiwanensis]|uniref:Uncharacterized protein n=1 Tax=Cupriavidus taiwanensis TaxID=164546 RepID=A0A375IKG6_9BURK|nr:hypothetical protein CBM2588_A10041 [Cupriavidus taiwanensis]SOY42327.1 hypothetical protein CBM2592_A10043 [Cupriavidus taiwanensis]SPK74069.1 protein of unknown function [Cupriavidus taiwanensis]